MANTAELFEWKGTTCVKLSAGGYEAWVANEIGSNVIIGTCSVVTHDIPDNSVAVGVPAKVIKTADEYFEKIQKESLHLGHLKGEEKDKALKKYYGYTGNSKGLYF